MSNYRSDLIPRMTKDLELWFDKLGEAFLTNLGVREGFSILDFGCGAGTYAIPAARVVGSKGKVYAIDHKELVIKEIEERTKKYELSDIIIPIKTKGEFSFPIKDKSVDFSLIYDVVGGIVKRGELEAVEQLVKEVHRVTKIKGKLSLAPKHVSNWRIPLEKTLVVINNYFELEGKQVLKHIHWDWLAEEPIYTFRKV